MIKEPRYSILIIGVKNKLMLLEKYGYIVSNVIYDS
jgi:hypothetical protein